MTQLECRAFEERNYSRRNTEFDEDYPRSESNREFIGEAFLTCDPCGLTRICTAVGSSFADTETELSVQVASDLDKKCMLLGKWYEVKVPEKPIWHIDRTE